MSFIKVGMVSNIINFWWLSDPNDENQYRKDNIPKKIQGMPRAENLWGA
jgi:hypothetical protein